MRFVEGLYFLGEPYAGKKTTNSSTLDYLEVSKVVKIDDTEGSSSSSQYTPPPSFFFTFFFKTWQAQLNHYTLDINIYAITKKKTS